MASASSDAAERCVVAYHYTCPDGAFGALAAHVALRARGASVRFAPLQVFRPEAERVGGVAASLCADETLYLIDITGGAGFIAACCARAKRVVVLDHHKTGEADLAGPALAGLANLETHFDMARSGATIARDYFGLPALLEARGDAASAARVLRLFALVEDNDLFRHALPDSKLFSAGLEDLRIEFDATRDGGAVFERLLALDADAVVARGRVAIVEQERVIDDELSRSFRVSIPGGGAALSCLAVVTSFPDLRSVEGNKLAAKSAAAGLAAAGAVVYSEASLGAETLKVSLRSVGDVDTTLVSQAFGGGGHKNASSFNVARATFESWRVVA
jgi:hypothetical protein